MKRNPLVEHVEDQKYQTDEYNAANIEKGFHGGRVNDRCEIYVDNLKSFHLLKLMCPLHRGDECLIAWLGFLGQYIHMRASTACMFKFTKGGLGVKFEWSWHVHFAFKSYPRTTFQCVFFWKKLFIPIICYNMFVNMYGNWVLVLSLQVRNNVW